MSFVAILLVHCGSSPQPNESAGPDKQAAAAPPTNVTEETTESMRLGQQWMSAARSAYGALGSGDWDLTAVSTAQYATSQFTVTQSARMRWKSAVGLRIDGHDTNGAAYTILSNNDGTWIRSPLLHSPAWADRESLSYALAEWQGVSVELSTSFPGLVADVQWRNESPVLPMGSFWDAFASQVEYVRDDALDGDLKCAVVEFRGDTDTWHFWIDRETKYIQRIMHSTDADQMKRANRGGGGGRSGMILSHTLVTTIQIRELNNVAEEVLSSPE